MRNGAGSGTIKMSCVIGLIEIEEAADCEFPMNDSGDSTLDFLFSSLAGQSHGSQGDFDGVYLTEPSLAPSRLTPPCPATCHVARIEANLEHLFEDLDAQTSQLLGRLVAARQQAAAE